MSTKLRGLLRLGAPRTYWPDDDAFLEEALDVASRWMLVIASVGLAVLLAYHGEGLAAWTRACIEGACR